MTVLSPRELLDLTAAARSIIEAARPVALAHFRGALTVDAKADESPVTVADKGTEARIREEITSRFPGHGILGEEFANQNLDAEFVWVVDPIDGTKSFVSGHPLWGMLLGLLHRGEPVLGVIAAPAMGEVATGTAGQGAALNGHPIAVRQGIAPAQGMLLINELPRILASQPAAAAALLATGRYQRAAADCYSYVQLAAGWVDGVVDYGLEPFDYLPVLAVVEAAGGVMTDWSGRPLTRDSDGRTIAGTPAMHARLLEVLAPHA